MQGERLFFNHHGQLLIQLPHPSKTTCSDPSNWVYDDDTNMDTDKDASSPQEGHAGGGEGGGGCLGSALSEEILKPPMTRSRNAGGSLGFNEAHFYQYLDDNFSYLNLRLDAIDELQ